MKYTEANLGRIFILRLEDGDSIPETIEEFAVKKDLKAATVLFIGGVDKDSKIIVGPEDGTAQTPVKMVENLVGVSEALGVGTIFTNETAEPKLHLHSACGRSKETITGCTRDGVDIWKIGEVIILELLNSSARREIDHETGFELLEV
ncbi:DNA-binding protein [Natroniella sulfidigena]|uniref:PPC domain-containing DNA-binding protein n=1 Tax=Natroniella sulfidigena TaxID=723921 RepID=UPI00200B34D1|nr:PPC domain-containing DNA-binding protein [Natroniella sulfidigena]MCK8818031.1 DNA-binding protein [Natroniella sulfidigena]